MQVTRASRSSLRAKRSPGLKLLGEYAATVMTGPRHRKRRASAGIKTMGQPSPPPPPPSHNHAIFENDEEETVPRKFRRLWASDPRRAERYAAEQVYDNNVDVPFLLGKAVVLRERTSLSMRVYLMFTSNRLHHAPFSRKGSRSKGFTCHCSCSDASRGDESCHLLWKSCRCATRDAGTVLLRGRKTLWRRLRLVDEPLWAHRDGD